MLGRRCLEQFDSATDTVMPHPFYAPTRWVCVVNPAERTRAQLAALLEEAHALAKRRFDNRWRR